MCSEVMCTTNTVLPAPRLPQARSLCTCQFYFHLQVAEDSFRLSENRGWAFGGRLLHFHVQSSWLWGFVLVFVPLPLSSLAMCPWLWGSPVWLPRLLLVQTQQEAPYQFPGRRRVVAPYARADSLIDATRRMSTRL